MGRFDIQDERAYAELMIPTREEAMKRLAVRAAEKMSYVLLPTGKCRTDGTTHCPPH